MWKNKDVVIVCYCEKFGRFREFKAGNYRDAKHLINNINHWATDRGFTVADVENTDHLTQEQHEQLCNLNFELLYK